MVAIVWGAAGARTYETGVDKVVLYPASGLGGVPWNGVVSINEAPDGGAKDSFYFDGVKYLDFIGGEDFAATLEAYGAPQEFAAMDGQLALAAGLYATQQPRTTFGLCYRVMVGNDQNENLGYKLHLVYGCTASPTSRTNKTKGADIDIPTRSWKIDTVPPIGGNFRPTAHFTVDSMLTPPAKLLVLENQLYGTGLVGGTTPKLPDQATVIGYLS